MLFELFKQIRTVLAEAYHVEFDSYGIVRTSDESEIRDIQYFADQYGDVIHAVPAIFIDLGRLDLTRLVKGQRSMSIPVTLHVVTEISSESDYNTPDLAIHYHEGLARLAKDALEGVVLEFEGINTRPLRVTGWSFYARYQGWMVTLLELETKA